MSSDRMTRRLGFGLRRPRSGSDWHDPSARTSRTPPRGIRNRANPRSRLLAIILGDLLGPAPVAGGIIVYETPREATRSRTGATGGFRGGYFFEGAGAAEGAAGGAAGASSGSVSCSI